MFLEYLTIGNSSISNFETMCKLILNILKLAMPIVLLAGVLYFVSDHLAKIRICNLLKFSPTVTLVFVGDSNIECAINDSLVPGSVNLACSGEAYLYTRAKLKAILENNPQIRKVVIGYAIHDLMKKMEDIWMFKGEYVRERNLAFNPLLQIEEKRLIFFGNATTYLRGIRDFTFANLELLLFRGRYDRPIYFGGFRKLEQTYARKAPNNFSLPDTSYSAALIQEKYLRKILELCNKKSVHLILLNTPKHPDYRYQTSVFQKQYLKSFTDLLPKASVMDFSEFPLADDNFKDEIHLNYRGANIFSQQLAKLIPR
jgi:hypothetical protein